ncbi:MULTISPECIES: hypothetical protein [Microcystis]|nr:MULTISPECIES: hypothetical protein [Microcystis]MCZ8225379.1 hypothetical protein [Microcystis sp. LE19-84.1B]
MTSLTGDLATDALTTAEDSEYFWQPNLFNHTFVVSWADTSID